MNAPILSMKPGQTRDGRIRTLTLARVLALSGGPFDQAVWPDKNLHTDTAAAQSAGLSELVVSGTQWEGYLVGLMAETFGVDWFAGGEVNIKLPRSVRVGETVQPFLTLESFEQRDGREVALMSVWCENGDAQQVLVGTASCPMPPIERR